MHEITPRRVAFLDRDGTIIVDRHYLKSVDQVEVLPGVIQGLKVLRGEGFALVVISNQGGVAKGRFTEADVHAAHAHIAELLGRHGVRLDAILYCPHNPSGIVPVYTVTCDCRKPGPGMAYQAEKLLGPIDYAGSWIIGDKPTDIEFGRRLGMRTALLHSEYWTDVPKPRPTVIAHSLQLAVASMRTSTE
ncbi:MAG: D-glycero-D-manno-heptose 1,7-bisphosphate phosphatase [Parcubacteria group bacterium Gr01-1014_106]|nr:MAG: D-glycero-D-manno-heptose 1,7-bisphosphate phosphatase [Parcubacteria group bacterium Gr01-1014_106]